MFFRWIFLQPADPLEDGRKASRYNYPTIFNTKVKCPMSYIGRLSPLSRLLIDLWSPNPADSDNSRP